MKTVEEILSKVERNAFCAATTAHKIIITCDDDEFSISIKRVEHEHVPHDSDIPAEKMWVTVMLIRVKKDGRVYGGHLNGFGITSDDVVSNWDLFPNEWVKESEPKPVSNYW